MTKFTIWLVTVLAYGCLFASAANLNAAQSLSQTTLAFTKNMGQWDDRVLFRVDAGGATMWFTSEGITYQFSRRIDRSGDSPSRPYDYGHSRESGYPGSMGVPSLDSRLRGNDNRGGNDNGGGNDRKSRNDRKSANGKESVNGKEGGDDMERDSIEQLVFSAKFVGVNPNPEVIAEGLMEYKCNYFLGDDQSKWLTDVPNYQAITLKDIYPGIDIRYSDDGLPQASQVSYEFIAAPRADIAQIKLAYEGVEETSLDSGGRLVLKTKWGDLTAAMKSPVSSPRTLGVRTGERVVLSGTASISRLSEDATGFEASSANRQAFGVRSVGLLYSTYLGGADEDFGYGIAVDRSGNAYVTGFTNSSNFPISSPYHPAFQGGTYDVFVTKFSAGGNSLIYSTYLGGGSWDEAYNIAVDSNGSAYITGVTQSSNFPTQNPFQAYQGSWDAFVTKLSSAGNSLIYSTYLGAGGVDYGEDIAVDAGGTAYVTGHTNSPNFPTQNPFQSYQGVSDYDAFVTKLSSSGNSLIYSTYLGGRNDDYGQGIAVDGDGNAHLAGYTYSSNFPILNPYQATYRGMGDAFVSKLNSSGSALIYSTYLGGGDWDEGFGIAINGAGNAFVTGLTYSTDFPTQNPMQATLRGTNSDAFVSKLSGTGNSMIFSTYLGGSSDDNGLNIAVDAGGNALVTGITASSDFPIYNSSQTYQGGWDAFVTKLSGSGSSLNYSTYLGGDSADGGWGIAVDDSGNAFVAGSTNSTNFPTQSPYQTHQGSWDVFVTKLSGGPDYLCGDADGEGTVNISDAVFLVSYIFADGPAPSPLAAGDADCDLVITVSDVVYLIAYIFAGGPAPCAACK